MLRTRGAPRPSRTGSRTAAADAVMPRTGFGTE
jgi:hypothetical protein